MSVKHAQQTCRLTPHVWQLAVLEECRKTPAGLKGTDRDTTAGCGKGIRGYAVPRDPLHSVEFYGKEVLSEPCIWATL